jgi:hypothetical protein
MKRDDKFLNRLAAGLALTFIILSACNLAQRPGGGTTQPPVAPPPAGPTQAAPSAGNAARDQNACHLLTHEEVSALVEEKIVISDQTEAGETWSTCEWNNESGTSPFILTVYWANGKQEWETWRAAQGLGNEAFEQAEGVSADDVVKQGPVAGLGDAAYFSELLPSLVLKDDVLFEMNLFFVPRAETKFASLARTLIGKIK